MSKYAIFICTHGRPDRQSTLAYLRHQGYTGDVYLVLDDTDKTLPDYFSKYSPEMLLVFNKQHYIDTADTGSIPPNFKTILYAKNAVEDIARDMKLDWFIIADDDISSFRIRMLDGNMLKSYQIVDLDKILEICSQFMFKGDFSAVGVCSNVQFIAGASVFDNVQKYRVPYNFVFRNSNHTINWVSSFGEDIITAMEYGKIGKKLQCIPYVQFATVTPGNGSDGGMSELYKTMSGYTLCFYDFMYNPSSIKLTINKSRWNAQILKDYAFPKLVSESYKRRK